MCLISSCKKKMSKWSAQLMLSNESWKIRPHSCGAMIWQTSKKSHQSLRHRSSHVRILSVSATNSRLTVLCQSLTDAVKTLLYSSQLLHFMCNRFQEDVEGGLARIKNCNAVLSIHFSIGEWKFNVTYLHWAEVQGSRTVLELPHWGNLLKP